MRLFGRELTWKRTEKTLSPIGFSRGGWFNLIREADTGNWQRNVEVDFNAVLSYHAIYACITLIASDIAKMRLKLVERRHFDTIGDIWVETRNPAYDPVIRRPNHMQNRIQFWETWILSKLIHGNTYVLKKRDGSGIVRSLYILDPSRVRPMIAEDQSIFYLLNSDNISGIDQDVYVPQREIIHDRMNTIYIHPLVGTSPIFASGVAATQGLNIQQNSTYFFGNHSSPGGLLTAPGEINEENAIRLKTYWEENFSKSKSGKIAVLGDGLEYKQLTVNAVDAQLIEQLKMTAEIICSAFKVPPYMIGLAPHPVSGNVQSINQQYYNQALQKLIEDAEACFDDGLGMSPDIGVEFDLDDLLRMDTATKVDTIKESIISGLLSPNEGRARFNLLPVKGGESPYLQQQNFSLEALAERDRNNPFSKPNTPTPPPAATSADDDDDNNVPPEAIEAQASLALLEIVKGLR